MLFSYKWLKEYFDRELPDPEELTNLLTVYAFEIEGLEESGSDNIIDIDVLPNRAHDALCHYGMAREISTITGNPLKELDLSEDNIEFQKGDVKVKVSGDFCKRYIAREVKNIKVSESPQELKDKLEAIGQRSINNIVDITNLVMFELNQPMHAFDADKLEGDINVRFAKDGEHITTLDNQEVDLDETIPVIVDNSDPLAMAGVKGGKKAEVDHNTTNIVLEFANFDAVTVRKTSNKTNVKTESSKRFENGITAELAGKAVARATDLILKYASTENTSVCESFDYYPEPETPRTVDVSLQKINSLLGVDLSVDEVSDVLDKLMFEYEISDKNIRVTAPSERLDLQQDVDVIEEIARIYGYDNIPDQHITGLDFQPEINSKYIINSVIRKTLIDLGFSEVITYSFVEKGDLSPEKPIADDKKYLRPSLREGMLKSLELNQKNADWLGLDHVNIFEIGTIFGTKGESFFEKTVLGIGALNKNGIKKPKAGSFIQEAVEKISDKLQTKIDVKINIDQDNFVEIDLNDLYEKVDVSKIATEGSVKFPEVKNNSYQGISPYPFVLRDIAVWLPNETKPEELVSVIKENSGDLLVKEPKQFDVYQKDDRTSYAYRLVFQSYEKTLTDEEVNQVMDKINSEIESRGWEIR